MRKEWRLTRRRRLPPACLLAALAKWGKGGKSHLDENERILLAFAGGADAFAATASGDAPKNEFFRHKTIELGYLLLIA